MNELRPTLRVDDELRHHPQRVDVLGFRASVKTIVSQLQRYTCQQRRHMLLGESRVGAEASGHSK